MESDVAGLVDTVDVTKAGRNREVRADLRQCVVDGENILWLGVQRVVIYRLVVDTVFLTSGDTDLLQITHHGLAGRDHKWQQGIKRLTISRNCFMGAARLRYLAVVSMFHSTVSSERSIMWLENRGSPCCLKYRSSSSIMPSNHGSSFFAQ